jgi:hypothetical protein
VPLVDYHSEIFARRTDDWDGAAEQYRDHPGDDYQVPTLIARDGVHPSNPEGTLDFSEQSLQINGYALRSYLTLHVYADVIRLVLQSDESWVAAETYWIAGVAVAACAVILWKRYGPAPKTARSSNRKSRARSPSPRRSRIAESAPAATAPAAPLTKPPPEPVATPVVAAKLQLLPAAGSTTSFLPVNGLEIDRFPFQIGRRPARHESQKVHPDLLLDDHQPYQVSRAHVGFFLTPEGDVLLRDLGSQLGVIVDGQLVGANAVRRELVLPPGEHHITLGNPDSRFRFRAIVSG